MLRLVLLLGIFEIIGLIQLGDDTEEKALASAIFRFIFSALRSLRGTAVVVILLVAKPKVRAYFSSVFRSSSDG